MLFIDRKSFTKILPKVDTLIFNFDSLPICGNSRQYSCKACKPLENKVGRQLINALA